MRQSLEIREVPAPPEGWHFFFRSFRSWPGLSIARQFAVSISETTGRLVALLPAEISPSAAADVDCGIHLQHSVPHEHVRKLCLAALHSKLSTLLGDADSAVIIEEPLATVSRPAGLERIEHERILTHGDEIYAVISSRDCSLHNLERSITGHGAAGSCLNGFVVSKVAAVRPWKATLTILELKELAESIVAAFCEAYDGDSFLLWMGH